MVLLVFAGICLPVSATRTVTGISPATGPAAGGTSITITGSGFTNTTAVTLGGTAVPSFLVVSDTSITTTTPPGTAGSATIAVTTSNGAISKLGLFAYSSFGSDIHQHLTGNRLNCWRDIGYHHR